MIHKIERENADKYYLEHNAEKDKKELDKIVKDEIIKQSDGKKLSEVERQIIGLKIHFE